MPTRAESRTYWPWIVGVAWLAAAVLLGATGVVARWRPPAPQLAILGLTLALVLAYRALPGLRAWALGLDPRAVPLFHLTRLVGAYFLVLHARGELPGAFAVPAGWGDLLVAGTAVLLLILVGRPRTAAGRRAYVAWNVLGLADMLMVVATAVRVAATAPDALAPLLRLPLSLLPTFLVPLILASHLLLFRLMRPRGDEASRM